MMSKEVYYARVRRPGLFGVTGLANWLRATLNQPLILAREPDNPADQNAIIVSDIFGQQMGYVERDIADLLAPKIDAGAIYIAKIISIKEAVNKRMVLAKIWRDGVSSKSVIKSVLLMEQ